MSEFDEEAERERLREQYERDQKKREVTEKMSELLLQGATMTNAHCQDCGDPIFRYDGQEFCPTCEKPVDRGTTRDADGEGAADADGAEAEGESDRSRDGDQIEVTAPSEEARVRFGNRDAEPETDASSSDRDAPEPRQREPGRAGDDSELARSRTALHRRLQDLSQRAGACDDPREAEAYLAAAREAAEALAVLRR